MQKRQATREEGRRTFKGIFNNNNLLFEEFTKTLLVILTGH
jgi:hypothetical protein